MNAKVNYTTEQVVELVSAYEAAPTSATVEAFAVKFDKTVKSIVAKLSREGVYQKAEKAAPGARGVQKESLMIALELAVGREMKSLKNLTIVDLQTLVDFMKREGNEVADQ